MGEKVERVEDRLADFTRDKRILILSLMALIVGAISAVVAYVLVWLIAGCTFVMVTAKHDGAHCWEKH